MKDPWFTFNALRDDAIKRGMFDSALVYGKSAVRIGMEILANHNAKRSIYDQMDRDLGDMIK